MTVVIVIDARDDYQRLLAENQALRERITELEKELHKIRFKVRHLMVFAETALQSAAQENLELQND